MFRLPRWNKAQSETRERHEAQEQAHNNILRDKNITICHTPYLINSYSGPGVLILMRGRVSPTLNSALKQGLLYQYTFRAKNRAKRSKRHGLPIPSLLVYFVYECCRVSRTTVYTCYVIRPLLLLPSACMDIRRPLFSRLADPGHRLFDLSFSARDAVGATPRIT